MMKIWNKNTGLDFKLKVNNMKYWHPQLHISVSTLVTVKIKINIKFWGYYGKNKNIH